MTYTWDRRSELGYLDINNELWEEWHTILEKRVEVGQGKCTMLHKQPTMLDDNCLLLEVQFL